MTSRSSVLLIGSYTEDKCFERYISYIEDRLSWAAGFPIIVPGVGKIALGITQTVCAFVATFFLAIPALANFRESQELFTRAISHIVHGLGNILVGCFELLPLVGLVLYFVRIYKGGEKYEDTFDQKGKFLAYNYVFIHEQKKANSNSTVLSGLDSSPLEYKGEPLMIKV